MIKVKRAELINAVLTVFTIIAVICGTCSIYSLADSDSTTDSIVFKDAAVLAENFNVYHGESAVTAGLSAAEPEKYFSVVSRIVKHTCTSTGNTHRAITKFGTHRTMLLPRLFTENKPTAILK